jgi:hypothetical protein
MGNKPSSREHLPTQNLTTASTVPDSSNGEEITIQDPTVNITDQLQNLFTTRSRNPNSTSSATINSAAAPATVENSTSVNEFSNMLSSLFTSSSSSNTAPADNSAAASNNSALASLNSLRTISGSSQGSAGSRVRIFERNGAYFTYVNNRLIQLQAPKKCPVCEKQINPFQEEYDLHVVKCMTKPRIKSVTFEVTETDHQELIDGDKECMICYEEYEKGQMVSRLECFCVYHKSCLENWLSRKQCCPLHMESNSVGAGDS